MFKILVLEDGEYEYLETGALSFEDLKKALKAIDANGVGGCTCCPGERFGKPLWTGSVVSQVVDTSTTWPQLALGLAGLFKVEATPEGVTLPSDIWDDYTVVISAVEEG